MRALAPLLALVLGCATPYRQTLLVADPLGGSDGAISPDGKRVALSSRRGGNWDVWIYEIATRAWTRVTDDPADDIEAQWSPDGRELAFTSSRTGNKDVFVVALATGALRQLTDSPDDDEYPSWSPDGRSIVYTGGPWKQRDFFVVDATGGNRHRVTQQPGWAGACTYFPDGKSLLCHRYDLGSGDIVRIPLNGSPPTMLTSDPAWDYKPSAPSGHDWIAFSRKLEGPSAIWFLPLHGDARPRPLTSGPADDRWPTWSHSGDKMLFHRIIEEGTGIATVDRGTGAVRTLVGREERPLEASFDPTGRRIVYCAVADGRELLRVLELDSGRRRTLWDKTVACFPRWSPRGDRIAFTALDGGRWEVATLAPDGTDYRVWTRDDAGLHGMSGVLDWSPDGRKIAFHADTDPFAADVFVVDTADGHIVNLTRDEPFDEAPSFTPDGKGIVFMSTRGGDWTWGLFRRDEDGRITTLVAPDYVEKNYVHVAPDGALVWSSVDGSGHEQLIELTPNGGRRALTDGNVAARWPSFSPDGATILFTTMARRTEYWLAEGLFGPGSPLRASVPPTVVTATALSPVQANHRTTAPGARSPVKLDHR